MAPTMLAVGLALMFLQQMMVSVSGRPGGAPTTACSTLTPVHGTSPIDPTASPPTFFIVSDLIQSDNGEFTSETTYNMQLVATGGSTFQGFIVQARDPSGSLIGTFAVSGSDIQLVDCPGNGQATVTHTASNDKTMVSFQWTAPSGTGTVQMRYSIVTAFSENFYSDLNAIEYTPPPIMANCLPDRTAVDDYPLVFRYPNGCIRGSCDYYVGMGPNPVDSSYLDIYLEGIAAGWVAIGFSENMTMDADDVLGCRVDSGSVTVVDTWNPSPRQTPNVIDATQAGLCVNSTSFTNGRITCIFSRTIAITDVNQDFNLDNSFWLFFGRLLTSQVSGSGLAFHGSGNMVPVVSDQTYNPVRDNNTEGEGVCPFSVTAIPQFPLIFRRPENCLLGSCNYFVGLGPNPMDPSFLDIYIEGAAQGWIAIGFSLDRLMFDTDVLGCRLNAATSVVTVVDTWNPSSTIGRDNVIDEFQNDTCTQSTSFTNGRITCMFSRVINTTDIDEDYVLDRLFNLIFSRRIEEQTDPNRQSLEQHSMTPIPTMEQFNPVRDNNTAGRCPIQATSVGNHRLFFGFPRGCRRSSCDYYVGINPNPADSSYLDFYLEGNARGWIAIGFSENMTMDADDVLGCRVDSGNVTVVDTWNPSPRQTANEIDPTQDGLCAQSSSFTNGRITCMFSRTIAITDPDHDYNLNNSFWLFFGRRSMAQTMGDNLGNHNVMPGLIPIISDELINPVLNSTGCPPAPDANDFVVSFGSPRDSYYFASRVNRVNPDYVDVRLEGVANGWVAIGFSLDTIMGADDVLACQFMNEVVTVVDAWNPPGIRGNIFDSNQEENELCTHSTSFENGRISCTFSRLINGTGNMDYNLNEAFYQFYARGPTAGAGGLPQHFLLPPVSSAPISLTTAMGGLTAFPRDQLTRVHGILMIIAWPLLVVTAIFFAAWMKPALPNGEWFQIHRIFMIVSLFATALGFILIFVANAQNITVSTGLISFGCGQNTTHFIIGILVFILQIINPIISIFRCNPTKPNRWIFNLSHGTLIGFAAEILALVNVGLGIALFETGGCHGSRSIGGSNYTILWIYIAFVAFLLILQMGLFLIFTLIAFNSSSQSKRKSLAPSLFKYFLKTEEPIKKEEIEMDKPGEEKEKKKPAGPPPRKEPSSVI
jgi:hypothetical protein